MHTSQRFRELQWKDMGRSLGHSRCLLVSSFLLFSPEVLGHVQRNTVHPRGSEWWRYQDASIYPDKHLALNDLFNVDQQKRFSSYAVIWDFLPSYSKDLDESESHWIEKIFSALLSEHVLMFVNQAGGVSLYDILINSKNFSEREQGGEIGIWGSLCVTSWKDRHIWGNRLWSAISRWHVYLIDSWKKNLKVKSIAFCLWQPIWRVWLLAFCSAS